MSRLLLLLLAAICLVAALPASARAATCADYSTQAQAQSAADTRDGDGDGRYCEDLPCPCAGPSSAESGGGSSQSKPKPAASPCERRKGVVSIGFSTTKYRNIRRHYLDAVGKGWPRILVVNRPGADARRDRLLDGVPTQAGEDRDEYPPAVGRGRGSRALMQGRDPVGWKADVEYVPSGENRSHGSALGIKLRRFCNGQRFRYLFY